MATTVYNGFTWDVGNNGAAWLLSRTTKGRMAPITHVVRLVDAPTVEDAVRFLDARDLSKAEAETAAWRASRQPAAQAAIADPLRRAGYAPAGTTEAHVASGTGRCRSCGRGGSSWNAGAGSFRCDRHWDAY